MTPLDSAVSRPRSGLGRLNVILGAALGAQLLLGVATWWPEPGPEPARPLVDVQKDAITEFSIEKKPAEGKPAEPVKLVRDGSLWVIATSANYPADPTKVDEILGYLSNLQVKSPIATKTANHAALKVGGDEYGRKVHVVASGKSYDFIVGASSGKAIHIREADNDDVYLVRGFSEFSLKERGSAYWNADLLSVKSADVQSFTIRNPLGAFTLEKQGETWVSRGAEATPLDSASVEKLLGQAIKLRMKDPVGQTVDPMFGLDGSTRVTWTVTQDDSQSEGGYLLGAEVDGAVYAKVDGQPFIVRVNVPSVKSVREATLAGLAVGAVKPPASPAGSPQMGMPTGMPTGMPAGMPAGMAPRPVK